MGEAEDSQAEAHDLTGRSQADRGGAESTVGEGEAREEGSLAGQPVSGDSLSRDRSTGGGWHYAVRGLDNLPLTSATAMSTIVDVRAVEKKPHETLAQPERPYGRPSPPRRRANSCD